MEAHMNKMRAMMGVVFFAVVMIACVSLAAGAIAATDDGTGSDNKPTSGASAGVEGCGSIAILLDNSGSFFFFFLGYSPQVRETVGRLVDTLTKSKTKFMFANIRPESAMWSTDYDLTSEEARAEFKNKVMESYDKGVSGLNPKETANDKNWRVGTESYAFKHATPGEWKNVVYVTDSADFGLTRGVLDHIAELKESGARVTVTRTRAGAWDDVESKPGMFYPAPIDPDLYLNYRNDSQYYVYGVDVDPESKDRDKSLMSAFDKIIDDKVCRIDPSSAAPTPTTTAPKLTSETPTGETPTGTPKPAVTETVTTTVTGKPDPAPTVTETVTTKETVSLLRSQNSTSCMDPQSKTSG